MKQHSLAGQILRKLHEASSIESMGGIVAADVNAAFRDLLDGFKYSHINVATALSVGDGVFVKFTDAQGDDVIILFTVNSGTPTALVVSKDDDYLEVDLGNMDVSVTDDGDIDVTDLSWMNKSLLDALLAAGKVNEAEVYVLRNGKKTKLPIVTSRSATEFADLYGDLPSVDTLNWCSNCDGD